MKTNDLVQERLKRPTVRAVLRMSSLLNSLTAEEICELESDSYMAFAERGETIWIKGKYVDFFGLVGTGFVKTARIFSDGQQATAEIFGPGQVFGLLGAFEEQGCPLSARAVCNCWYLKIPKTSILAILDESAIFKDLLLIKTCARFRQTSDMLVMMSSGKVKERLALILIMLSESYGRKCKEGIEIQVPLTRYDLAEMAGTTVETTIRTISRWQKQGKVVIDHKIVTIIDEESLLQYLKT